jgi:hypothetical protein
MPASNDRIASQRIGRGIRASWERIQADGKSVHRTRQAGYGRRMVAQPL